MIKLKHQCTLFLQQLTTTTTASTTTTKATTTTTTKATTTTTTSTTTTKATTILLIHYFYHVDCQFPFQYNGIWYDTCTDIDRGFFWCSIDTIYVNRFANCAEQCPELARILVKSDAGELHTSCQAKGSTFTKSLIPDQNSIN